MNGDLALEGTVVARERAAFLTAVWSHVLMLTFAVPDEALAPHLPPGTVPDRWDGKALASLVAFDFLDTRVRGGAFPGFRDFPEWNLRIYVRHDKHRGVAFVREFVPNPVVASIARAVYNEPYRVAKFESVRAQEGDRFSITHRIHAEGAWHSAGVTAREPAQDPPETGIVPFVKEQAYGYGRSRRGRLIRYRVEHPPWRVYPVEDFALDVDFGRLYGAKWAFLAGEQPLCAILAEGSAVTVYPREVIRPEPGE